MSIKAVVVYSGGMDSFTVLYEAITLHGVDAVAAISVDYGQRHVKELGMAATVCNALGVPYKIVNAEGFRKVLAGSALTTDDVSVPHGHYADETMRATVVPNRNMILISLAAGYAISLGAKELWVGVHAGDHAIYPDCRPAFIDAMRRVLCIANYEPLVLEAPWLLNTKTDILAIGLKAGLDYSQTWTCYQGEELACGKCGSCVERLEAFAENHAIDPLPYAVPNSERADFLKKSAG